MNCPIRRRTTVRVERLEDRSMMAAGVTAALNAYGVLSIAGTTTNDTVAIHAKGTQLTVDGVSTAFNAAQVKSIDIDGRGGNDAIRLSVAVGDKALSSGVTIHGAAGMDTVTGQGGLSAWLSGVGNTMLIAGAGVTLNGFSVNWFDQNLRDTALRTLVKQDFADGVLGRADMLGIFYQVARNGTLNATDFGDLKAIANNASLFKADYVQQLTQDVVLGNVANARYQGLSLGNMNVGSSVTLMTCLVNKWFLGSDRPLGTSDWGPTYAYAQASGTLFNGTPTYADIRQGGLGDCYFLTALAETAVRSASIIQNMFIVNGDGTYTVRFYHNGAADYVTVDSYLPVDQYGRLVFNGNGASAKSSSNVLWADLAEKAYVQLAEQGWSRALEGGNKTNAYRTISGGYIFDALSQITGHTSSWVYHGSNLIASDFNTFVAAWNSGNFIGFASAGSPASSAIVGNHAYAVLSYNAQTQQVTLFNPWGVNNGSNRPGIVTLSWTQIQASFVEMDYAR